MIEEEKYNGWTNYETWALYMWLTSDEGLYNAVLEVIEANDDISDKEDALKEFDDIYDKEDALKEFIEDLKEADDNNLKTMFDDVGSLWRVNWDEITRAFIDE